MIFWGIVIFLVTITVHEVSHGFVAFKLGDPTAKNSGRLTLNPIKHIDLFWTVLFPAILLFSTGGKFAIGMAKPVPVNFARLRNPKRDMIWVSFAGPLANILFAGVLAFLFKLTENIYLLYGIYFNLGLAVFNLIPIPPLDGSKMLAGVMPIKLMRVYLKLEPFGFLVIFLLYMGGLLIPLITPGIDMFCKILDVPTLRMGLTL